MVAGNDTASGVVLTEQDVNLSVQFPAICLDSTVTAGEELTWDVVSTLDGVDLPTASGSGAYADWNVPSAPFAGYGDPGTFTATDSGSQAANMSVNVLSLSPADAGKILLVSLALKDADDNTVSGACPTGGGGGGGGGSAYVTMSPMSTATVAGRTAYKGVVSPDRSLAPALSAGMAFSSPAPNGGVFYWNPGPTATVQNLVASGVRKIANSQTLAITLPQGAMMDTFGWYGTARNRWAGVATVFGMTPSYSLITGSLVTRGSTTKSLTLGSVCAQGQTARVQILSAPIDSVYLHVRCFNMMGGGPSTQHVLKVTGTATLTATRVASVGTTTAQKPCSYGGIGVNERARGAQAAIILYGAVGAGTTQGGMVSCTGTGQSDRVITTIPATGGAPKVTRLTRAPFGTADPVGLTIAPGRAAGSWIAFGATPGQNGASMSLAATISAQGVVTKRNLRIDQPAGFPAAAPGSVEILTPVLEISATRWLVSRNRAAFGTGNVVTLASYNPQTGQLTSGQPLVVTGVSGNPYGGSQQILYATSLTIGAKQYLYYYGLTAAGKFKVASWWAPTR